jgi:UDP-3-O-[3-hydroxymyristoyl] glucosamine N-acyltransferase
VVIENNVDIGAGCTIARGVSGDTIIGEGTKIDSQVLVGHGVVIGKNCLLAGQVGIGGKAIIEDGVILYGQVGVAQRIRIGKGAVVSAKSGVSKNLAAGKHYFGIPAAEIRTRQKELAALRQLPEFLQNHSEELDG